MGANGVSAHWAGSARRPQRRVLFPSQRIHDKVMISQRPVEVVERVVAGHSHQTITG
jgi:hypothetical protein